MCSILTIFEWVSLPVNESMAINTKFNSNPLFSPIHFNEHNLLQIIKDKEIFSFLPKVTSNFERGWRQKFKLTTFSVFFFLSVEQTDRIIRQKAERRPEVFLFFWQFLFPLVYFWANIFLPLPFFRREATDSDPPPRAKRSGRLAGWAERSSPLASLSS